VRGQNRLWPNQGDAFSEILLSCQARFEKKVRFQRKGDEDITRSRIPGDLEEEEQEPPLG